MKVLQMKALRRRRQFGPAGAILDAHRRGDAQKTSRRGKFDKSDLVDGVDKGARRAVHRRRLIAFDKRQRIIDANARERRHEMLNCRQHRRSTDKAHAQMR
jgi:hypothetical protein